MLMNAIRTKQLEARKSNDVLAGLYTTLLGEAQMIGKNDGNRETTDNEVISVVKKFIKNIDETVSALTTRNQDASVFLKERQALEVFLPKQLNEPQLYKLAAECASMPEFMKFLKENYAGQYDGKLASSVAKGVYS